MYNLASIMLRCSWHFSILATLSSCSTLIPSIPSPIPPMKFSYLFQSFVDEWNRIPEKFMGFEERKIVVFDEFEAALYFGELLED